MKATFPLFWYERYFRMFARFRVPITGSPRHDDYSVVHNIKLRRTSKVFHVYVVISYSLYIFIVYNHCITYDVIFCLLALKFWTVITAYNMKRFECYTFRKGHSVLFEVICIEWWRLHLVPHNQCVSVLLRNYWVITRGQQTFVSEQVNFCWTWIEECTQFFLSHYSELCVRMLE